MTVILATGNWGTDALQVILMVLLGWFAYWLWRPYLKLRRKATRTYEEDSKEIIEEDHDILGRGQIDAMLSDQQFGNYGERFALAALKRRLDFLDNARAKYDSDNFFVETQRIGRALKIKWRFKPNAPRWYDIVGFRRTGGFFSDQWDETNNGKLVIHSDKDGESTELLNTGEAVYYTFFLKPWNEWFLTRKCSLLRFQVTISTTEETEALKMLIARLQESSLNQNRPPNISQALKELGSYVEFDNAIEQEEKMLARQIEQAGYKGEEKKEKLERLREVVADVRERYSQ